MNQRREIAVRWMLFGLLTALLGGAGCTSPLQYLKNGFKVGPNYQRPGAEVAPDWIDANDVRIRKESTDLNCWWTVFRDPALDRLIPTALNQNLTLREAGFRVWEARYQRAIVVGEIFPQTQQIVGGYSRNVISSNTANSNFLQERYFNQWDGGFNLAWELDFWGRFRRAIEAADADLDASVDGYNDVMVTLLADIAQTYTLIRLYQAQLTLVRDNVKLQQETLTLAEARFRGGQVSELDVDQAASNLAQTEALIPQLDILLRQASNRLCILMGMPPKAIEEMIGTAPIPSASPDVAVGIPAQLLARRPDIRRAERLVAAQSALIGVAESELYPHIAITGMVGYSSMNLSNLVEPQSFQGTVGPGFQWNVLNYGRLKNNVLLQDAKLQQLIASYQNTVLSANAEVEDGLVRFLRSQERVSAMTRSVTAAQRGTNIVVAQYRGGMVDFNRVALLEQNLVEQQDLLAQSQGDVALGLIEVYRALGGGWERPLCCATQTRPTAEPVAAPQADGQAPGTTLPQPLRLPEP